MSAVDFFDFSRATQGTYIGKNGLIQTANANVPRFQFDASGNGQGAIIEPAATNLLKYSDDFTQSVWNTSSFIVQPNYSIAPDGTQTGSILTSVSSNAGFSQFVNVNSNTLYTFSIWMKVPTGTLQTSINIRQNSTYIAQLFVTLNTSWQRLTVSATPTDSVIEAHIGKFTTLPTGTQIEVWGAQLEQGAVPTSYIKTTSAAVTRTADEVRTEGKIYQIEQSEGAIFAKVNTAKAESARVICDLYSTNNTGIKLGKTNTDAYFVSARVSGTETANVVSSNVNYQGINKVAARYNATGLALYVNGIQEGSASVNVANVLPNSIAFGHDADGQNHFIEPISGFSLFKRALGNNELKGLTE